MSSSSNSFVATMTSDNAIDNSITHHHFTTGGWPLSTSTAEAAAATAGPVNAASSIHRHHYYASSSGAAAAAAVAGTNDDVVVVDDDATDKLVQLLRELRENKMAPPAPDSVVLVKDKAAAVATAIGKEERRPNEDSPGQPDMMELEDASAAARNINSHQHTNATTATSNNGGVLHYVPLVYGMVYGGGSSTNCQEAQVHASSELARVSKMLMQPMNTSMYATTSSLPSDDAVMATDAAATAAAPMASTTAAIHDNSKAKTTTAAKAKVAKAISKSSKNNAKVKVVKKKSATVSVTSSKLSTRIEHKKNHSSDIPFPDAETTMTFVDLTVAAATTTDNAPSSSSSSAPTSSTVIPYTTTGDFIDGSQVTVHDVLMGRGGRTNHHPGNLRYLDAKRVLQSRYALANKREKTALSQELVDMVRKWGGRFIKLDQGTNFWYEVDNLTARTKASQTLRENFSDVDAAAFRAGPAAVATATAATTGAGASSTNTSNHKAVKTTAPSTPSSSSNTSSSSSTNNNNNARARK
jgi:hypothetical protein